MSSLTEQIRIKDLEEKVEELEMRIRHLEYIVENHLEYKKED